MSSTVIDVLYIKQIEKKIGRRLDAEELERIRFGEPIHVETKNGFFIKYNVPTYRLPHDLSPDNIDYDDLEKRERAHYARYRSEMNSDQEDSDGVSDV